MIEFDIPPFLAKRLDSGEPPVVTKERQARISELVKVRILLVDLLETIDKRLETLGYEPPRTDTNV